MLSISEAVSLVTQQKEAPLQGIWRDYDISQIPFVVYDDETARYIGHPNPPQDRPLHLAGATSIAINDVQTATLPVQIIGEDETRLVPVAYHEGFHVYQHHHFAPLHPNFFMAMSHYPELDPEYRTLCQLEADVLRADWSTEKKLTFIATLTALRRERLAHHESLLGYEGFMERNEGTASYVEQKARHRLYGIAPQIGDIGHGWSRFYQVGAALCWLLDATMPDWMAQVEAGASLGDLVMGYADKSLDLNSLNIEAVRQSQKDLCEQAWADVHIMLEALQSENALRIGYAGVERVYRAFNPSTMISLGDGRVLHRDMFQLIMPDYGKVAVTDGVVIDDIVNQQIIVKALPVAYTNEVLSADGAGVQIDLKRVAKADISQYILRGDV